MKYKTYLGDGVYADFENGQIVVTTEDGFRTTNRIYLEPHIFEALVGYVKQLEKLLRENT